jgi:branched-chain amino acid transport system substrate-binding protein
MRKLSSLTVASISIIVIIALVLSGCSSSSSTTSASTPLTTSSTTTASSPSTTSPKTTTSVSTTTSAPTTSVKTTSSTPATTGTSPTTSGEPIKIGLVSTLSGMGGTFGGWQVTGSQMVVDKINASGGLLGRQVQLMTKDDMFDPSQIPLAGAAMQSAGVVGIIGCLIENNSIALGEWGKANKVPVFAINNAVLNSRTTNFSKYVFQQYPPSIVVGRILAQQIAQAKDVNSIYYLASDATANYEVYDTFWSTMSKLKPSIKNLGAAYVGTQDVDFSNIITATLAKKPDLVINFIMGPPWANFAQQANSFKYFDKTKTVVTLNMEAEATVSFGTNFPSGIDGLIQVPFWLDTPEMKAFTQDFYGRTKSYPGDLPMEFYMATLALTQAIQKAGTTDTDKVISALENLTLNNSPLGTVSYNDYDHQPNIPLWYGTGVVSSQYQQAILQNVVKYQDGVYPTKDEILALRQGR